MKLYRITSRDLDPIFFKAESGDEAKSLFVGCMDESDIDKYINHKSFSCIEVTTIEQLMELIPYNEFCIDPDSSI